MVYRVVSSLLVPETPVGRTQKEDQNEGHRYTGTPLKDKEIEILLLLLCHGWSVPTTLTLSLL